MEPSKIRSLTLPILKRFQELEELMSSPAFHKDPSFTAYTKEHSILGQKAEKIREWEKLNQEKNHLDDMIRSGEPELSELAKTEKEEIRKKISNLEQQILRFLIPKDPYDEKNIILELRAGTGGDESSLFAQELSRMYLKFAESHGFRCETVSLSSSERGGFKEAVFLIEGTSRLSDSGPFSIFKYERGVHRVQRVPETEAGGRIHTSTVTVAVLPEAEDVEVQIQSSDLKIDTYRASGHGGQHLQKTDSAVRITHIPSGIVVQCQDERSQGRNRDKAMKLLRAKLFQRAQENQAKQIASERKMQVGTGERSEKIRTYNFPQDRITDHRIGENFHNIPNVLDGNLGPIIQALQTAEERQLNES